MVEKIDLTENDVILLLLEATRNLANDVRLSKTSKHKEALKQAPDGSWLVRRLVLIGLKKCFAGMVGSRAVVENLEIMPDDEPETVRKKIEMEIKSRSIKCE